MDYHDYKNDSHEEWSLLLGKQVGEDDVKNGGKLGDTKGDKVSFTDSLLEKAMAPVSGSVADGLPLAQGSMVGHPVGRARWDSNLCACLGYHNEFFSQDLEVCVLGTVAPCVLYGSNEERLEPRPGNFGIHCLTYAALIFFCPGNCLAPCSSYRSRSTIRQKYNLEGGCEALHRSCGCCGCFMENEAKSEQCETLCDFATHFFCHKCALCQEGSELRHKLPYPGFNAQPILVMTPPMEQSMGYQTKLP